MKIFLLRHGQTEANANKILQGHTDSYLGDYGRKQAQALGKSLHKSPEIDFDLIYSSDLIRCKGTILPFYVDQKGLSIVPTYFSSLVRERNYGVFENRPFQDYHDHLAEIGTDFNDLHFRPENGESINDLRERRIKPFLENIVERGQNLLIVSHGETIVSIFKELADVDLSDYSKYIVDNASISTLENKGEGWKIIDFNNTSYSDLSHLDR